MADQEDLGLLKAGNADLSRCDFRQADLKGISLAGRDVSGAHFDKADLSGADLRGAVLTGASFNSASLIGANLEGMDLRRVAMVSTNLSKANLRNVNFSAGPGHQIFGINFSGSDLRGANFQSLKFNEKTNFEGAIVDESTNFEGASLLRAQSRLPIFSRYKFERGSLSRKSDAEVEEEGIVSDPDFNAGAQESPPSLEADVDRRTLSHANAGEALTIVSGLSVRISQELAALESRIPNDPDSLEVYESYRSLLQLIIDQLSILSATLDEIATSHPSATDQQISQARAVTSQLSRVIGEWATKYGAETLKSGINVGGLALGTLGLAQIGADPTTAMIVCGALFGGQVVASAIGGKNEN